jgi:hypothetical protein
MGFSFIGYDAARATASAGTIATDANLNVAVGDLIVVWVRWEGTNTTCTIVDDDANNLTMEAVVGNGNLYSCVGYIINSPANGTALYTATLGAAETYRVIYALQFRPDALETVTKDDYAIGTGASTALLSGNINTSGLDEVILGLGASYYGTTFSAWQIADVNAGATQTDHGESQTWYTIYTTDPGDAIQAQATKTTSCNWIWGILAFKSVAAGATLEQEGFRFRNDDGSESAATWLASQETNILAPAGTTKRLRFIVNATGDPAATQYQLEGKVSTDSAWTKIN